MSSTLVGSIVGPILDIPTGGSGAQNTGRGYDVALGDLFFNIAPTDKDPYQRATAQFRKDQFDSGQSPGDQSLTGWWTRGQLSFHHGAGVKYYEVSEGETVLNRFADSNGVDVWTPGQVTLTPSLSSVAADASVAVPGTLSGAKGLFYCSTSGIKFYDGTSTTTIGTSDSGIPTDITSDGRYFYVANAKRIERQSTSTTLRTNWVTNPNFETDTAGWSATLGTISRDTTTFYSGSASLKADGGATSPSIGYTVSGLSVGTTYRLTMRVKSTIPILASTTGNTTGSGVWELASGYFTATGTTRSIGLQPVTFTAGAVFYVDNVMVTEAPFEADYFDGSTTGAAWTGTANASTSTFASNSPTASYVLFSNRDFAFKQLAWAKGRVWAVDSSGRWYTPTASLSTVGSADAFWSSGITEGGWSLADSPSAVYLSNASTIYSVVPDATGAVPTLSAATVAATLPAGENISCILFYLGNLVIATNKGVRVAATNNSGELLFGPLVITGDFSTCNRIGATDSRVFITGLPTGHTVPTVCVIDLSESISDLRPAWSPWLELPAASPTTEGSLVDSTGRLFVWCSALYGSGTSLAPSGYLTTGQQRFATLEPKRFEAVKVRATGSKGTIAVARVDQDGTVVPLYTMDVAHDHTADIGLGLNAAVEAVGLKFTLTRDGVDATAGPTLLGYQLRALPQPQRQRLIRIPLLIDDQERRRPARAAGHLGAAWERLKALEDLENSGTPVLYKDFRTGETASVYVESVEFTNSTPPTSARDSGFGGVAFLTVKKLA